MREQQQRPKPAKAWVSSLPRSRVAVTFQPTDHARALTVTTHAHTWAVVWDPHSSRALPLALIALVLAPVTSLMTPTPLLPLTPLTALKALRALTVPLRSGKHKSWRRS